MDDISDMNGLREGGRLGGIDATRCKSQQSDPDLFHA